MDYRKPTLRLSRDFLTYLVLMSINSHYAFVELHGECLYNSVHDFSF